jgi:OFA family oxalate/formate antiporter-like MFS transporter
VPDAAGGVAAEACGCANCGESGRSEDQGIRQVKKGQMPRSRSHSGTLVLLSASLLALALGSIHAFSVLVLPLESRFQAPRALVSVTYSIALGTLTLAVLLGHRVFARFSASRFVLIIGTVGALGAGVAATAPSLPVFWLGYSLLFGGANGMGYGYGLQIASQSNAGREGTAMGIVTAAYALGATISPVLFAQALTFGGIQAAMFGLGIALISAALTCASLMHVSGATFKSEGRQSAQTNLRRGEFALLWVGYGSAVAAGLMTIGHATGIASSQKFGGAIWAAPALIAAFSLAGSLIAGRLVDRMAALRLLVSLPALSVAALSVLSVPISPGLMMCCLAVVGFSYGGIIAAYPAVIAKMFGAAQSSLIYGRVFTAWGCAGIVSPWLAGRLFDSTGSYQWALRIAGLFGLLSICAILALFRRGRPDPVPCPRRGPMS